MHIDWLITATWGGSLQNFPLHGKVRDYKQKAPGLIIVAILCTRAEMIAQIDVLTNPSEPWCSGFTVKPYFEVLDKENYYAIGTSTP